MIGLYRGIFGGFKTVLFGVDKPGLDQIGPDWIKGQIIDKQKKNLKKDKKIKSFIDRFHCYAINKKINRNHPVDKVKKM